MTAAALIENTAPKIKLNGVNLPATALNALRLLRVERGLCIVGRATLRFIDDGYQVSTQNSFALGAKVSIDSGDSLLFSGTVTGASLEQLSGADHPELVVTVDDAAYKLSVGSKAKAYLSSTYADIVQQLAVSTGLTASVDLGSAGSHVYDYLLQTGSDLAYLDTIARRCGCAWWVDDTTFHVAPTGEESGATATVELGKDLIDFSVRASGLRPTKVTVQGWDANAQQDVVGMNSSITGAPSSKFLEAYVSTDLDRYLPAAERVAGEGNPNSQGEADALAAALLGEWSAGAVVARGNGFVNPAMTLLCKLTVQNAGPASGTYTVSELEHVFRPDGFFTRFVAGPVRPTGLVDTLGGPEPDAGFVMNGLLTATVTDNNDSDHTGQVKVKFAGTGDTASTWARVVSLGGGATRGAVFHPEVNDEVLVGFERGDPRHPVVIGGLYSPKNSLAADNKLVASDGTVDYRRITSRLGHVVELSDGKSPDVQHVLLQLGNAEHKFRLGKDACDLEVASGVPITIKAGSAKFAIDAEGNINMEGNKITIKATTDLVLQGLNTSMKAQANVAVEAQVQLGLKGAIGNVEASGPMAVKGAIVAIN